MTYEYVSPLIYKKYVHNLDFYYMQVYVILHRKLVELVMSSTLLWSSSVKFSPYETESSREFL